MLDTNQFLFLYYCECLYQNNISNAQLKLKTQKKGCRFWFLKQEKETKKNEYVICCFGLKNKHINGPGVVYGGCTFVEVEVNMQLKRLSGEGPWCCAGLVSSRSSSASLSSVLRSSSVKNMLAMEFAALPLLALVLV